MFRLTQCVDVCAYQFFPHKVTEFLQLWSFQNRRSRECRLNHSSKNAPVECVNGPTAQHQHGKNGWKSTKNKPLHPAESCLEGGPALDLPRSGEAVFCSNTKEFLRTSRNNLPRCKSRTSRLFGPPLTSHVDVIVWYIQKMTTAQRRRYWVKQQQKTQSRSSQMQKERCRLLWFWFEIHLNMLLQNLPHIDNESIKSYCLPLKLKCKKNSCTFLHIMELCIRKFIIYHQFSCRPSLRRGATWITPSNKRGKKDFTLFVTTHLLG